MTGEPKRNETVVAGTIQTAHGLSYKALHAARPPVEPILGQSLRATSADTSGCSGGRCSPSDTASDVRPSGKAAFDSEVTRWAREAKPAGQQPTAFQRGVASVSIDLS